MSLGLRQRREVAFVLAKAVTSVWSPSAHTGFHVHHQRAAVTSDQRRACACLWWQGPPVTLGLLSEADLSRG